MKKTLDELLAAVNQIAGEENTSDELITFIEDLTDTLNDVPAEPDTALQEEIDGLRTELESWKKKYKYRFLGITSEEEVEEEVKDEEPDGRTITTKDIFKDKED